MSALDDVRKLLPLDGTVYLVRGNKSRSGKTVTFSLYVRTEGPQLANITCLVADHLGGKWDPVSDTVSLPMGGLGVAGDLDEVGRMVAARLGSLLYSKEFAIAFQWL
jgi:hypothetical protein